MMANELEDLYSAYAIESKYKIKMGLSGKLKITPDELWLRVSENCNLKCLGCHVEGKFKKSYTSLDDVRKLIQLDGSVSQIRLTTNEALLHPEFCEIIEMCREVHPKAKLWLVTNGTIPIKGRYKKAFSLLNKVGISIDGASKDVFESIRIGASFDVVIENIKAIVELRKQTGSPEELTFAFTATSTNLHELIQVVRLAYSLGVPQVWAQPMEAKDEKISAKIDGILIDRLEPELRSAFVDAAREEAKQLGIRFYFSQGLYPLPSHPRKDVANSGDDLYVKLCQFPWSQPAQISEVVDGYVVRPCCYMLTSAVDLLGEKYGLKFPEIKPMDEIYNSTAFWSFREELMEGRTQDVCGNCQAARDYSWKPIAGLQCE